MKSVKKNDKDGRTALRIRKGVLTACAVMLMAGGCSGESERSAQHIRKQTGSVNDILEQQKSEMQSADAQDMRKTDTDLEGSDPKTVEKQNAALLGTEQNTAQKNAMQENAKQENAAQKNSNSQSMEGSDADMQSTDRQGNGQPDVDLTVLSATMVYAEVYQIMTAPENYVGKIIKMKGDFTIYDDTATDKCYFTCIIRDATACCAQGIEFELLPEYRYPEDYPKEGSEITVQGRFELYDEDGLTYCTLRDSKLL